MIRFEATKVQDIFSVQTVWSIVSCFDNFHFQNLRSFEVDLVEKELKR